MKVPLAVAVAATPQKFLQQIEELMACVAKLEKENSLLHCMLQECLSGEDRVGCE